MDVLKSMTERERAHLKELAQIKDAIEGEVETLTESLTSGNGPGLHGNLVDQHVWRDVG